MVAASLHFWTGCAEVFFESPRQTPQGQETRLADPRCSTQDACKKNKNSHIDHKHSYILHTDPTTLYYQEPQDPRQDIT